MHVTKSLVFTLKTQSLVSSSFCIFLQLHIHDHSIYLVFVLFLLIGQLDFIRTVVELRLKLNCIKAIKFFDHLFYYNSPNTFYSLRCLFQGFSDKSTVYFVFLLLNKNNNNVSITDRTPSHSKSKYTF